MKSTTHVWKALMLSTAMVSIPVFAQDVPEEGILEQQPPAPGAQDIVIYGQRAAERAALENKRLSDSQIDQVQSDDVGRLPDQNVAETLRRLPGLSVANDMGEGRYLTVRGVSPDLLNVTLNGETAAAPEPDSRQVKLDDIPSALIGAVTVTKTLTPDLDANSIAGSADIKTITAFDKNRTFGSLRGAYGYNRINGSHPYEFDGSFGTLFGPANQFGIVVAANYSKRHLSPENVQTGGNWDVINGFEVPLRQVLRRYDTHRQRKGAVANFDWRPTDNARMFIRFLYSEFDDSEARPGFLVLLDEDEISNQTATSGDFEKARARRQLRTRTEDSNTFTVSTGGDFDIGESWLRADVSYTRAKKRDPHRDEWIFEAKNISGSYDLSDRDPPFDYDIDDAAYDPTKFKFKETSYEQRKALETLWQGRVDYRIPINWGDRSDIQIGAKYIHRKKTNEDDAFTYGGFDGSLTLDQFPGQPIGSIFHGRYLIGPTINGPAADDFFGANQNLFELDEEATIGDSLAADYLIKEKILAGYAMARLRFGKFTAIPGARFEHTKSNYAAKSVLDTSTLADIDKGYDTFGSQSYSDLFPGINLRYDATRNFVLRGAVTRAIGRPNYEKLAPFTIVNTADNEVEMGNPNLKPLYSTNFDAAVEYYLGRRGILSAAVFYKKIEGPIYTATTEESGTFAGQNLVDAQVTRPVNAKSATVSGLELHGQYELGFLPTPLDGFILGGSITFVKSKAKGIPGRPGEHLRLPNQSNRVASAFLAYEKYGIAARVAYTHRSAYLLESGDSAFNDIYVGDFNQWDARVGYALTKFATVFVEGSNLNDEPNLLYQGARRRVDEVERYGYSVRAGLQLAF
jgi:TonB-dependent receptor